MSHSFGVDVRSGVMRVRRLMHAHDNLYHIPVQTGADIRDEVPENCHGGNLEGARAVGVANCVMLAICLSCARGRP